MLEQEPAGPLQDLLVQVVGGLAVELPAEVGELLVEQLHDVEPVEHDLRVGQVCLDRQLVGGRHVDGDRLDPRPGALQASPKGGQGLGSFAISNKQHAAAVQVQHHREVAVAVADGDLVDGQLPHLGQRRLGIALGEVGFDDLLHRVPADR